MITVPKRPGPAQPQQPQVPDQYLMMAAATMHEMGRLIPQQPKADDAPPTNRR